MIAKAKERQTAGAGLILWTCREGTLLQAAVDACKGWGLTFDAINESLPDWIEAYGTRPRKVGATEYWDDRAVLAPVPNEPLKRVPAIKPPTSLRSSCWAFFIFRYSARGSVPLAGVRNILTLDLDNIPAGGTEDVLRRVDGLGCGYCIYSTRKHSPAAPRLRVLLPLDRTVSADEYEPLARKAAEFIGMELMDPTTFEVSRLMYWPSCCADSQYIYLWQDRPLISANGLLAKYEDWRDCALWPQVPGAVSLPKLAVKQGDPEGKKGVVGAFCRTYDVFRAMDELIPGMYEPVDNMPGRYTYLGGSTTGGAVVYDNGKFLYSHHATDPCSNRLVNAFDLVRLHRFGDKDDEAQPGTPTNRLPSYVAMCELAVQDAGVAALMSQERYQEAVQDFEGVAGDNDEDPANWMTLLALNTQTGLPKATIDNVWIILEHDPLLKGRFALNRFAGRGEVLGALPWDARTVRRLWDDNDNEGLYWYMERPPARAQRPPCPQRCGCCH